MNRPIDNESRLVEAIRALPKGIRPERDLWPAIDARLPDRGSRGASAMERSRWSGAALAASVILVFAAGILLGRHWGPEQTPARAQVANLGLRAALQASEKEYQAAFRQFIPVGDARKLLEDQAIRSIENSWGEMQQAEAALLTALERHPENIYLNQRLLDLRAQQLAFMQQLATLDRFSRRST